MSIRAGIFLQDQRLTFLAVTGRRNVVRFTLEADENLAGALQGELTSRRLKLRRVRLGLQRALVVVKVLELPPAVRSNVEQVLRFELERHVPFPPEEMSFDHVAVPSTSGGPLRLLTAACERATVDRALRLLEAPKVRPQSVTVACHDLPALLRRRFGARRVAWAHRTREGTGLVFLGNGQLRLSRFVQVRDGAELASEIGASLRLLKWKDCEAIWVSGHEADEFLAAAGLGAAMVSEPPWSHGVRDLIARFPVEDVGASILALAVAAGRKHPILNLLPVELRPRSLSPAQRVTAALVVLAAGAGVSALMLQGYQDRQYLARVDAATRALDPPARAVERIGKELNEKKRLLATIRAAEETSLGALPLLRELTEILPADAWLNTLTVDGKTVEMTGQAAAASQLIPLLESSSWLERVEFTSPVTRGREKEQFRIKAALERGPGGPPLAARIGPVVERTAGEASSVRPGPAAAGPTAAPAAAARGSSPRGTESR
jgi:Tfp pilus assembly protein PilN